MGIGQLAIVLGPLLGAAVGYLVDGVTRRDVGLRDPDRAARRGVAPPPARRLVGPSAIEHPNARSGRPLVQEL